MDKELDHDRRLDRESDFKYPTIEPESQVRLLRLSFNETTKKVHYHLEAFSLIELPATNYRALSYTSSQSNDIVKVLIDKHPFSIRRNLFHFLTSAEERREHGLFFIDAICINQLDNKERNAQVKQMGYIYRNANEVIAWLGIPDENQICHLQDLIEKDSSALTVSQEKAIHYLSDHGYWTRLWTAQEILLGRTVTIWCGSYIFPLSLLQSSSISQLQTSASKVLTHKHRHVPLRRPDSLTPNTNTGTLEDIITDLKAPTEVIIGYETRILGPLHRVMRQFGGMQCEDKRDKIYGVLGLVNENASKMVVVDYDKRVEWAFHQALKVGLWELHCEQKGVNSFGRGMDDEVGYLNYYRDLRALFELDDGETLEIFQTVLQELGCKDWVEEKMFEVQHQRIFGLGDEVVDVSPEVRELMRIMENGEEEQVAGCLFTFHGRQRRVLENLRVRIRERLRRRREKRSFEKSARQSPGHRDEDVRRFIFSSVNFSSVA